MTTILVVDDQPITLRVLGLTLRNEGYDIVTAEDGLEALSRLDETPVDLVLLDIAMPRLDGITLLRTLRASERHAALPVIMLTANGQDSVRKAALAAGADGFLTKPTSSRELIETVGRFVYACT
ncbi:MAG: response regulator [Chloroflexi bacterium]|nr:response regulator [Chloroflexota bacterium]